MTGDRQLLGDACPSWCLGSHDEQSKFREDRHHQSARKDFYVETSAGWKLTMTWEMAQYPFATDPAGRGVRGYVYFDHSDREMSSTAIREMAVAMDALPGVLRYLAGELDAAVAEDARKHDR